MIVGFLDNNVIFAVIFQKNMWRIQNVGQISLQLNIKLGFYKVLRFVAFMGEKILKVIIFLKEHAYFHESELFTMIFLLLQRYECFENNL